MSDERPPQPVSYWYDAEVTVRVYLDASPAVDDEDTRERVEDTLTRLLDSVHEDGVLLSVHGTDLGSMRDDSALHRPAVTE